MMAEQNEADRLLLEIFEKDTNRRLQAGVALQAYLDEEENSVHDFDDVDRLIAGLVTWISSSHPKICTNGIEALSTVALVLGDKFKSHLNGVIIPLRERLGDARQPVREAAIACILNLMDSVGSPQVVMDKLLPDALAHKGWHVREHGLITVSQALERFGTKSLLVGRYMTAICKLISDANYQVRDQAISVLVDVYRHIGERIRGDLAKKGLPPAKLELLYSKFDELQLSGGVSVAAPVASAEQVTSAERVTSAEQVTSAERVSPAESLPAEAPVMPKSNSFSMSMSKSSSFGTSMTKSSSFGVESADLEQPRPPSRPSSRQASSSGARGMTPHRSTSSLSGGAATESGAVDEDDFERGFEDCTAVFASSPKEVDDELSKVEETLTNTTLDWEVRVAVMKRMKGLLNNTILDSDILLARLPSLRGPFATALKDLRSSVVREACITVALMASKFEIRLDGFCDWVLPPLFLLVPNSAKIMASSAHVCIKFIIQHVHSHRLIPLFAGQNTSKSATVRRRACEYIEQILLRWERHPLEKQISHLEDSLKKSINDADSGTRTFARQAYWAFANHFPSQAEKIKNSLEPSRQRMLASEQTSKTPSRVPAAPSVKKSRIATPGSLLSSSRRFTSEPDLSPVVCRANRVSESNRSRGATEGSARRVEKASYGRPISTATAGASTANSIVSPAPGVSAPRHTAHLGAPMRPASATPGRSKPLAKLPTVSKTPGRLQGRHTSESVPPKTSVTTPSPDDFDPDENMIADDLLGDSGAFGSANLPLFPGGYKGGDDDDTISIASDISTASTASNFSIQSMSGRLHIVEEVPEILRLCQSGMWSDRRDGLASLGQFLQGGRVLAKNELQRFLEVFFKLFNDPHNTVLGVFLDVLMDFIIQYRLDIRNWLQTLFQRVFSKLGTDVRSSIARRLQHLQDVIRESFDASQQLAVLCKVLNDQSQPHHLKVKLALLKYLHILVSSMEACEVVNTSDVRQGINKIAGMANEPKNVDVRRTAARVLHVLHLLNEEVFMKMMAALPRNMRDSTMKVVQDAGKDPKAVAKPRSPSKYPRMSQYSSPPSAGSSPVKTPGGGSRSAGGFRVASANFSSSTPDLSGGRRFGPTRTSPSSIINRATPTQRATPSRATSTSTPGVSRTLPRKSTQAAQARVQAKPRSTSSSESPALQTVVRHVPTTPSPVENASALAHSEDDASLTPQAVNQRAVAAIGATQQSNLAVTTPLAFGNASDLANDLTPSNEDVGNGLADEACLSLCVDDDAGASIPQLLEVLSSVENVSASMQALESLGELAIEDDVALWDIHFPAILETDQRLFDSDKADIRVAALRFFRQLICFQPTRFTDAHAGPCIAKLLSCYVDPSSDVVRQVEDMIPAVATALPGLSVINAVLPVISKQEFPQVICCLKLLTKIASRFSTEEMTELLPVLVPPLIQNYAHSDSSVRKASVFCLVSLHSVVDTALMDHLKSLTSSQMRLLTMYIERAKTSSR